jgi:formylglycine-generating enzyme required for sulfatase activity
VSETTKTSGQKSVSPAAEEPGARSGFTVLFVLILCVALLMYQQSRELTAPAIFEPAPLTANLTGFLADAFFLPADSMLGFVEIPAGRFLMGSNPAFDPLAYENERWSATQRQGSLALDPFYLGRFEVTVAQFHAFLNATGRDSSRTDYGSELDHPVHNVTWTEALAYCRWLQVALPESSATPPALSALLQAGWMLGLPTEAQWEKAARGSNGDIYPWGMQSRRDRANFSSGATRPVGASPCPECNHELADMSGNVWEMTSSPYQPYPYDESDDRVDLESDALWVMRGGSYMDAEGNVRTATRGAVDPGVRNPTIGLRVALTAPTALLSGQKKPG